MRCQVCAAPNVAAIDALVKAQAMTLRSIAADTGVAYSSLARHARNHVAKGAPPPVPSTSSLPDDATPFDVLRASLDDLLAMDTSKMSPRDRIGHREEIRRAVESLHKLTPVDPSSMVLSVHDIAGLEDFIGMIADWLDTVPRRPDVGHPWFPTEEAAIAGQRGMAVLQQKWRDDFGAFTKQWLAANAADADSSTNA
jgi:hypothetical protein